MKQLFSKRKWYYISQTISKKSPREASNNSQLKTKKKWAGNEKWGENANEENQMT